jgi:hypothetical protein
VAEALARASNGARGLLDLVIAVADLDEAAARFQRFTAHRR